MSEEGKQLTNKQRMFIQEYLHDFNATQAAIRAGYSIKTSGAIGSENLKKPEIKSEISRLLSERAMSREEVIDRLGDMARSDIASLMDITPAGFTLNLLAEDDEGNKIPKRETKLVKKIKQKVTTYLAKGESGEDREVVVTELELYDAQAALALIGKYHSLFVDRTEITGQGDNNGGPIIVKVKND